METLLCFFTVVMNRLRHLQQTLAANLRDNRHPGTSFLILDYSSSDGVYEYVKREFADEMACGRLKIFRYEEAVWFSHAHSRNIAAELCDADLICNVDADNFTGRDFDVFLQSAFSQRGERVVTALSNRYNAYGAFGRMCTTKEAFLRVGGYDETFNGYGFEDYDLVSRLESAGLQKIVINEQSFLRSLPHGNTERVSQQWNRQNLYRLYRQQLDTNRQVLLYLFKDYTFHYGVLHEDLKSGMHYRYKLAGNQWLKGQWCEENGCLQITFETFTAGFSIEHPYLVGCHHRLVREDDSVRIEEALLFNTNMANCCRYIQNKEQRRIVVNENGFGNDATARIFMPLKNIG